VTIKLPNNDSLVVNTDKKSFWNQQCRELISKDIGHWLISKKLAPWKSGNPPKFKMEKISKNSFRLVQ
jgi:hypothetical protein